MAARKPTPKVTKKATPKPKITKKPSKPVTERQSLDVRNMTPREKADYLRRGKSGM